MQILHVPHADEQQPVIVVVNLDISHMNALLHMQKPLLHVHVEGELLLLLPVQKTATTSRCGATYWITLSRDLLCEISC